MTTTIKVAIVMAIYIPSPLGNHNKPGLGCLNFLVSNTTYLKPAKGYYPPFPPPRDYHYRTSCRSFCVYHEAAFLLSFCNNAWSSSSSSSSSSLSPCGVNAAPLRARSDLGQIQGGAREIHCVLVFIVFLGRETNGAGSYPLPPSRRQGVLKCGMWKGRELDVVGFSRTFFLFHLLFLLPSGSFT